MKTSRPHSPPFPPAVALVSGVLAVSTGAIFARLADAPALVIAAYRVGLAVCLLAPIAWYKAGSELHRLQRREYGLALLAGFFLALHFATWISSLAYTSIAASVILVNTNPIWVGICTPWLTHDRLSLLTLTSIALSVLGSGIIGLGDASSGGHALWGDVLALAGSLCAAGYLLLGRALRQQLSLLAYVMLCYGSAALLLWTMALVLRLPLTGFSTNTYTMFFALALIPQIIGHSSYNWALKWFSPNLIAVSLLGEPIGSAILAYVIFAEGLTWSTAVGAAFILSAIGLAAQGEQHG